MILSTNLTYQELIDLIKSNHKQYPNLDILNQPVTLKHEEYENEYFNIVDVNMEDDGHFTLM